MTLPRFADWTTSSMRGQLMLRRLTGGPWLTNKMDLRPSRSPPRCVAMALTASSVTPARSSQMLRCVCCASSAALRTGNSSPRRPSNFVDALEHRVSVARELDVRQRRQRIDHRHEIVRPQLLDERAQRASQRNHDLRRLVDVVVVEKQHEQPDIVSRRLRTRRARAIESAIDSLRSFGRTTVEADELHGLDRLSDAVLLDDEVGWLQRLDRAGRRDPSPTRRRGRC